MPTFGHTKSGRPVHAHTRDYFGRAHLQTAIHDMKAVRGFNAKLAVLITRGVGSMACAYVFCLITFASLPAVLIAAGALPASTFPHFMTSNGLILVVAWIAQTFLQLVLLSIIMVGQSVQSAASDARSEHTFEDTQSIIDALDTTTKGGITDVMDRLAEIEAKIK